MIFLILCVLLLLFKCRHLEISNYTNWHDVDEDKRTIADYGGYWTDGTHVGIARRDMASAPSDIFGSVASSSI